MNTVTLILILAVFTQSACASHTAGARQPSDDPDGVSVGMARKDLILRIGAPIMSRINKDGRTQDMFKLFSGVKPRANSPVAAPMTADLITMLVTLLVTELIIWQAESSAHGESHQRCAVYDADNNVQEWKVAQGDEEQDC
jgi:PBP1b-binding outer membrane lipoprotein LpoB